MAVLLKICCCTIIITSVVSYNFDVNNIIIYEDLLKSESLRNSYFGFAVAFRPLKYPRNESEILIGAPRANISESAYIEPGSVFRCNIGSRCKRWKLKKDKNELKMSDNSWFGGTIVTGIKNPIYPTTVMCGWKWRPWSREELPGVCYQSYFNRGKSGPTTEDFVHLPDGAGTGANLNGNFGNVGMSAYITQDDSDVKIIMGGPGLEGGFGLTIRNDHVMFEDGNSKYNRHSHQYFGYATTSGYYYDKQLRVHAMGGPRADKLRGGVTLYNFKGETPNGLQWDMVIRGEQIGAYFGASLASCDINGDGKDELLVGAPFWSNLVHDAGNFDLGRIYVYRSMNEHYVSSITNVQTINGEVAGERFGTVITCLGDIDHDGFGDIAVSGPYNSNGVVYIFNGAKTGQLQPYSQKLLGPKNVRGFGISISQPQDIDHNGFADIAVGAYLSGHVIIYRSKIVASIGASLTFKKDGTGSDYRMNYHVVELCSTYNILHSVKQPPQQLNTTVKFEDVDEIAKWTRLENSGDFTRLHHAFPLTLNIEEQSCHRYTVGVKKRLTDFLRPNLTAIVKIRTDFGNHGILTIGANGTHGAEYFDKRQITASPTKATLTLPPRWNCASSVCQENLSVQLSSNLKDNTVFTLGSKSTIDLVISVENSGEDAFDTQTQLHFPSSLSFIESNSSNCVDCVSQTENNTCIECFVDQLLVPNQRKFIHVELDARQITTNDSTLNINTFTSAAKLTGRGTITKANLPISCEMNVNMSLNGESKQISYRYVKAEQRIIDFKHVYKIQNHGISPIDNATLTLLISTHWNQVEIVKVKSIKGCSKLHEKLNVTPTTEIPTNTSQSLDNMSCQNSLTRCITMECWVGPLNTAMDQAIVILELQLNPADLPPSIGHGISLETSGYVEFSSPENGCIISGENTATSSVKTQFIQFAIPIADEYLAWWIIVASILLGLLLIALLGFILYKMGFFARSKKAELDQLRNEENSGLCQDQDQEQQQVKK